MRLHFDVRTVEDRLVYFMAFSSLGSLASPSIWLLQRWLLCELSAYSCQSIKHLTRLVLLPLADSTSGSRCWHRSSTDDLQATSRVCHSSYRLETSQMDYRTTMAAAQRRLILFDLALTHNIGWLTSIAWIAVLATGSVFVGTIWQGLIILDNDSYQPQKWQGTLLCWAVLAVAVFINTVVSGLLPMIEGIILVLHVLGFVAVIVPLVYLSPHGSAASVFKTVLNEGGWPTQGMSYCVGFIGNVATFVGMHN